MVSNQIVISFNIYFAVNWKNLGPGQFSPGSKVKIGIASSLEEAKAMMLNYSTCAQEGAILLYPKYEHWGIYCGSPRMIKGREVPHTNWEKHQLSFQGIFYPIESWVW